MGFRNAGWTNALKSIGKPPMLVVRPPKLDGRTPKENGGTVPDTDFCNGVSKKKS